VLGALYRVADAVRPGQTDPGTVSGPRLLGPDGASEHAPLQFYELAARDVDALTGAARALGGPRRVEVLTDALAPDGDPDTAPAAVARTARLTGCWTWRGPRTPPGSAPGCWVVSAMWS